MTAYATVGSTRFDDLVTAVLSTECLHALVSLGIYRLSVQRGSSPVPMASGAPVELEVDVQDYVNDVDERISAADLVISHAGASAVPCCSSLFDVAAQRLWLRACSVKRSSSTTEG